MFYRWQKEFFEDGAAAFQSAERPRRQAEEKQKRIEFSEKKVQTKDEVLAQLMAELFFDSSEQLRWGWRQLPGSFNVIADSISLSSSKSAFIQGRLF